MVAGAGISSKGHILYNVRMRDYSDRRETMALKKLSNLVLVWRNALGASTKLLYVEPG